MTPPTLGVALLTYRRTDLALQTIGSFMANIFYPGPIVWYLADDGSDESHTKALLEVLGGKLIGFHHERLGPGPSWNKAVAGVCEHTPYIFWLEDDWRLTRPLDIEPYVDLLAAREDVGMVRLGGLPVGLRLESVGWAGRHYLDVLKERQYAYSGNPSIRHYRHFAAYGGYPTDQRSAGECEVYHDHLVRERPGPAIWWPVDIGGWGVFGHIGGEKA